MRYRELPFTGPETFFKAPFRPLDEAWWADIGLLGIPYDFAVGFRPGARFAPSALRAASGRYAPSPQGYFDPERERYRLRGVSLVDAGDVDPAQLEHHETFARITRAAKALRQRVRLPVFVGGDHSVSYPLLLAYADIDALHVVQLDAHLDFSDSRNATRYANSSPFRRAVEALPTVQITVIGLRGLRTDPEAWQAAKDRGHTLVSARHVQEDLEGVIALLPQGQPVYISFDIDVLSPSLAPGTSSPEVEGLGYHEAMALVGATISRNTLVGFDLTEIAPNLDPSGLTALVGARLLAETLAIWADGP